MSKFVVLAVLTVVFRKVSFLLLALSLTTVLLHLYTLVSSKENITCLSARKRPEVLPPVRAQSARVARARAVRPLRPRATGVWRLALSLLSRARPWSETSSASRRRPSSTADLRRRPRHHRLGEERARTLALPRHDHQPRPRLQPQDLGQLVVVADGSGYVGLDVLAVLYEHLGVLGRLGVAKLLDERDLPTAARTQFR